MGHSAVHEYLQTLRRWYKVKRREAPPSQPTCSSGALWSVGCFGCANSRLSSVIAQKQMCAKYRTLPIVGIGLDIATIISHLDQPVQRVILTDNLPVYLLLSTVFRQYFTQQPGLVVHIIGQLIRREKTVPGARSSDFCGARAGRRRIFELPQGLMPEGVGGAGALQTSCAREKSGVG